MGMATMEHAFKTGMELNGSKLFPFKVVLCITRVDDVLHWTGEIIERLGMCVGLIIHGTDLCYV